MMRVTLALVVLIACGSPPRVVAPPFTSPGALSASHGETTGCNACHVDGSKTTSNDKCLACHQTLRELLAIGRGFHASLHVKRASCAACHHEHRGRTSDVMGWASIGGRDRFDHDTTGWPLEGAHRAAPCADCHHATDKHGLPTFLGTDSLCGSCHADTVHGLTATAMRACGRCHTEQAWTPARARLRFDHDERADAAFPTLGAHHDLACVTCHPALKLKLGFADPTDCRNCHASPHAGTIMSVRPCAVCHSPMFASLNVAAFDHASMTRLELGPAHRTLACTTCHTRMLGTTMPPFQCEACHAARSPHQHRFDSLGTPAPCGLCHSSMSASPVPAARPPPPWRVTHFDHQARTSFALRGMHANVACRACHRGRGPTDFERFPAAIACMDCHAHTTVHADAAHPNGKYINAECRSCHRTE